MRAKSSRERSVGTALPRVCRASDGELLATTCAPRSEHVAAALTPHALAEPVLLGAMALLGLVRLLGHWGLGSFEQAIGIFRRPACRCGLVDAVRGAVDHLWSPRTQTCIGVGRIIRDDSPNHEDTTVPTHEPASGIRFLKPGSATVDDFERLDLRVGRVLEAELLEGARKPAYKLRIDFGPGGLRQSSAQLTGTYPDPTHLIGRLVVAVVNFAPRRVAGFQSEVLVLGAIAPEGQIPLLGVDPRAEPGQRIG